MEDNSFVDVFLRETLEKRINNLLFELDTTDLTEVEHTMEVIEPCILLLFWVNSYETNSDYVRTLVKELIDYYSKKVLRALNNSHE